MAWASRREVEEIPDQTGALRVGGPYEVGLLRGEVREMEKIPYVRTLRAVSDGAAFFYLMSDPMPSGMWLFLQHVAVEDETTNFNNIRIGQGTDPTHVHWWEDRPVPAAGVLYEFWPLFFVPEGSRVIIRLDATTVGDMLRAYLDGYESEKTLPSRPFRHRKAGE